MGGNKGPLPSFEQAFNNFLIQSISGHAKNRPDDDFVR